METADATTARRTAEYDHFAPDELMDELEYWQGFDPLTGAQDAERTDRIAILTGLLAEGDRHVVAAITEALSCSR